MAIDRLEFDAAGDLSLVRAPAARQGAAVDRALFAEDLGELLQAGLPLREALAVMARGLPRAADRASMEGLRQRLLQGATLSQAMAEQGPLFGDVLVALVRASEQTSDLPANLGRYASAARRLEALRNQLVSAAIYPALVTVVGLGVVVFLLGWVLPSFTSVLDGRTSGLSGATARLVRWAVALGEHRSVWLAALGAALAAVSLPLAWPGGRQRLQQVAARLPGLRPTLRLLHASRFFASCSTLTQGGVPAVQALELAAPLLLDEARAPMRQALARLRAGEALAEVLPADLLGDPVVPRLLEVGQRTGALPATLARIAVLLEARVARQLQRLIKLLEPALMLLVGLGVGGVVLLMYLPLLELSSSLQP
ncbi:type II secretion system F family protein [Pseudaquabacterium pictum]|uniref:Type IV pilin biogenesis protein n=1 Tax=Pseudaquabacterium pictum TaxID=2315236 RepID=A0A480AZD0_9BURK|nr:type II secretion system F family protein [Rubrivivax pictus]GCL66276.1 type IV pilin biogenesis protein [Rubrivivax pictus]